MIKRWWVCSLASLATGPVGCVTLETCCLADCIESLQAIVHPRTFTADPSTCHLRRLGAGGEGVAVLATLDGEPVELLMLPIGKAPPKAQRNRWAGADEIRREGAWSATTGATLRQADHYGLVIVCRAVARREAPIYFVEHDRQGRWRYLCDGAEDDHQGESALCAIHAEHLLEHDAALRETLDLPVDHVAVRGTSTWVKMRRDEFFAASDGA